MAHLTAINKSHTATMPTDPVSESNPCFPATSTSTSPSLSSNETESIDNTQSTTSKTSIASTVIEMTTSKTSNQLQQNIIEKDRMQIAHSVD